ncbi:MAG: UvrD-helicase domain-containing protein [Spirochaetaceae bacterium]|jgi:DNA helicase-2/ATP-dependent DNA helicase PcrA|nr:UvrD-helicase domain-containing protein [Spirochaetaceae bacterium]
MQKTVPSYLEGLNEQQLEAVKHKENPLLILAGAGSGKTRVITTRIAYLIDQFGFEPSSILAVTFTNKAASEMSERVHALIPDAYGVMIKTFHSFGSWLLRRNAPLLDMKSHFTIYDDDDVISLLKTIFTDAPRNELRRYSKDISRAKDDCLTPDDDLHSINPDPDFREIYRLYEKKLREIGNADFGDLISLPVRMLRQHDELKKRIHQKFRVILVDEYQDSNGAQFQLLQELAGPDSWLAVVGDDDQSIYRFRGAVVKNILTFNKTFPHTKVIKLEENYRSTGNILSIASSVVSNNSGRLGKTLWTRKGEGKKGKLFYTENQITEAQLCGDNIIANENYGNTAILYRTNAQSREFESTFRKMSIPYRLVGTISFYSREEIKDTVAFLSFLSNTKDEVAFRRIVNKPSRGLGKVSQDKVYRELYSFSGDLLKASEAALKNMKGKGAVGLKGFCDTCSMLIEALEGVDNLSPFVDRVIRESGLLEYHRAQDEIDQSQKVRNLEELVTAADQYHGGLEGLSEFLELIELDQTALEQEETDPDRVTLITMHNTKGLEFDRVFVTGMEEGLFPRADEYTEEDEIEEERRLFYVSITRARKELFFTCTRRRMLYGRTEDRFPSRFLEELPEEYVDTEGEVSNVSGEFKPGTRLFHEDYGVGIVNKNLFNNGHTVLHVVFESGRSAVLMPEFCAHKLEKLGNEDW